MLHAHVFGDPADPPLRRAARGERARRAVARRLAEAGRGSYGFDLRGHGRSPWDPPWTLERFAADVLSTMDDLGLGPGRTWPATRSAAPSVSTWPGSPPARVRRLVLVDPAVGIRATSPASSADAALDVPSFGSPAEAGGAGGRLGRVTDPAVIEEEVAGHSTAAPTAGTGGGGGPRRSGRVLRTVPRPVAAARRLPTLILRAPREKIVRRGFLAACSAAGSDVTLMIDTSTAGT
jgi:lipase